MGEWTVFRRGADGARLDEAGDLTLDQAFALMLNMAGTRWAIIGKDDGGFRLDLTRAFPVPDRPGATAQEVADFWPLIESAAADRRTAEREIKREMLSRGRDNLEARRETSLDESNDLSRPETGPQKVQ